MAHEFEGSDDLPFTQFDGIPKTALIVAGICVVLGLIAFIVGLATDPARTWRAYLSNWLFFTSITAGATMWSAIVLITRGMWSQPIRRIMLSFVTFLPIAFLLLLPLLAVSGKYYFTWNPGFLGEVEHIPAGKTAWLNMPFVYIRNILFFAGFVGVALAFAYWSLRPDLGGLAERVPARVRGLYGRFTRDWQGIEAEEIRASHRTAVLAPILAILYGLSLSIIAFDFVMSLEPEWKSTLLGGYFFGSALLGGLSVTAVTTILVRKALRLDKWILPENLHDLGKLHFGFTVVWGYLFWAQFIVIWYGLLPTEQSFVNRRFSAPYDTISLVVLFCLFVIPFFGLLGVKPKKTPGTFLFFAGVTLIGLWFERWLLVYPSWYNGAEAAIRLGIPEIGLLLGFGGILALSVLYFLSRFPVYQLWRPLPELELIQGVLEDPMESAEVS